MKLSYEKTDILTIPCPYRMNQRDQRHKQRYAMIGSRFCINCLHNTHCGDIAWHGENNFVECKA